MTIPTPTRNASILLAVLAVGCDSSGLTWGDGNSVITAMSPDLWAEVEQEVYGALETTTYTVRDEKDFTVTYAEPGGEHWNNMRRFRVLLLAGRADDWFVAQALEHAEEPVEGPGVHEVRGVWSRDQIVTVVVLPPENRAEFVRTALPEVHERLDRNFRRYVYRRMYLTGLDSVLADTLRRESGFELMLPRVYRHEDLDTLHIFRNDNPDPSELIRQIAVTWAEPIPEGLRGEDLVSWRNRLAALHYNHPQSSEIEGGRNLDYRGRQAYEVRGRWTNPPELGWPAGGLFVVRGVPCLEQDRMYVLDAWLYAPGKQHYEYVIQLETLLDTFRCGSGSSLVP